MKYLMVCMIAVLIGAGLPSCRSNTNCTTGNTDTMKAAAMQADSMNAAGAMTGNSRQDSGQTMVTEDPAGSQGHTRHHSGGKNDTFVMHNTQALKAVKKREGNFTNGSPN